MCRQLLEASVNHKHAIHVPPNAAGFVGSGGSSVCWRRQLVRFPATQTKIITQKLY